MFIKWDMCHFFLFRYNKREFDIRSARLEVLEIRLRRAKIYQVSEENPSADGGKSIS